MTRKQLYRRIDQIHEHFMSRPTRTANTLLDLARVGLSPRLAISLVRIWTDERIATARLCGKALQTR